MAQGFLIAYCVVAGGLLVCGSFIIGIHKDEGYWRHVKWSECIAAFILWPCVAIAFTLMGSRSLLMKYTNIMNEPGTPRLSRKQRREIEYQRQMAEVDRETAEAHARLLRVLKGQDVGS